MKKCFFAFALLCALASALAAEGDNWQTELSAGFSPTFVTVGFDGIEETAKGGAFAFDGRVVNKNNGLSLILKAGIGNAVADFGGWDYEGSYGFYDFGDMEGFNFYGAYLVGKKLASRDGRVSFTPALGFAFDWFSCETSKTGKAVYGRYEVDYEYDADCWAAVFAVCADFRLSAMFSPRVGFSASLLAACALVGSVDFSVDGYSVGDASADAGTWSFVPQFCLTFIAG